GSGCLGGAFSAGFLVGAFLPAVGASLPPDFLPLAAAVQGFFTHLQRLVLAQTPLALPLQAGPAARALPAPSNKVNVVHNDHNKALTIYLPIGMFAMIDPRCRS